MPENRPQCSVWVEASRPRFLGQCILIPYKRIEIHAVRGLQPRLVEPLPHFLKRWAFLDRQYQNRGRIPTTPVSHIEEVSHFRPFVRVHVVENVTRFPRIRVHYADFSKKVVEFLPPQEVFWKRCPPFDHRSGFWWSKSGQRKIDLKAVQVKTPRSCRKNVAHNRIYLLRQTQSTICFPALLSTCMSTA